MLFRSQVVDLSCAEPMAPKVSEYSDTPAALSSSHVLLSRSRGSGEVRGKNSVLSLSNVLLLLHQSLRALVKNHDVAGNTIANQTGLFDQNQTGIFCPSEQVRLFKTRPAVTEPFTEIAVRMAGVVNDG